MRILLRNVITKKYLNSSGGTDDIDQALDFKAGAAAVIFAAEHDLSEIEVVYAFPDPKYNFCSEIMSLQTQTRAAAVVPGKPGAQSL